MRRLKTYQLVVLVERVVVHYLILPDPFGRSRRETVIFQHLSPASTEKKGWLDVWNAPRGRCPTVGVPHFICGTRPLLQGEWTRGARRNISILQNCYFFSHLDLTRTKGCLSSKQQSEETIKTNTLLPLLLEAYLKRKARKVIFQHLCSLKCYQRFQLQHDKSRIAYKAFPCTHRAVLGSVYNKLSLSQLLCAPVWEIKSLSPTHSKQDWMTTSPCKAKISLSLGAFFAFFLFLLNPHGVSRQPALMDQVAHKQNLQPQPKSVSLLNIALIKL